MSSTYRIIVKTELVQNADQLESLRESWWHLAADNPLHQPDWLISWWHHSKNQNIELYLVVVRDDEGRVRAIAPLYRDLNLQAIRFLGDSGISNESATILLDRRFNDEPVIEHIATFLLEQSKLPRSWKSLLLKNVSVADPKMQQFQEAMLARKSPLKTLRTSATWQIDLSFGWNDFLQGLSQDTRIAIAKQLTDLDKVRIRWVHDQADLEELMSVLKELNQKQATHRQKMGFSTDDRLGMFLTGAARTLLLQNQLQAVSVWLGQRPIAVEIGFRNHDLWRCCLTVTDPEVTDVEPGKLIDVLILKSAERFGIKSVTLQQGAEPMLLPLKTNATTYHEMQFAPPNFQGRTQYWLWKANDLLHAFTKRWKRR